MREFFTAKRMRSSLGSHRVNLKHEYPAWRPRLGACLALVVLTFTGNLEPTQAQVTVNYTNGQTNPNSLSTNSGLILSIDSGQAFQSGPVGGSGNATKTGNGTLVLSGSGDNVALAAVVSAGTLVLGKNSSASVHAIGGGAPTANLIIEAGATAQLGGSGDDQIYFGANVQLYGGGVLDLNGRSEGFDALLGNDGRVTNSAADTIGTLTLGQGNGSFSFRGTLNDGYGDTGIGIIALTKTGSGTLTLTGESAISGGTLVRGGALTVATGGYLSYTTIDSLAGQPALKVGVSSGENAALNISGGNVSDIYAILGESANSTGTATVFAGSWSSTQLTIGKAGTGVLTLYGGTINAYEFMALGGEAGGNGSAIISGGVLNPWDLRVGAGGNGTLTLFSGAISQPLDGSATIGNGSTGLANVSGGTWEVGTITVGSNSGNGSLLISGGTVSSQQLFMDRHNNGSTGVVTVAGGILNVTTLLAPQGGQAVLNVAGGSVSAFNSWVGSNDGTPATANVSSGNWTSGGELAVGRDGAGQLNLSGGTVSAPNTFIGYSAGASGNATVSGGIWNTGDLSVGYEGNGSLTVAGGVVSGDVRIGDRPGSFGNVTVSNGTLTTPDILYVGFSGTGIMNIAGGNVTSNGAYLGFGGGEGTINVSGGTWNGNGTIQISQFELSRRGALNISGGVVNTGTTTIYNGTVTVSGGTWTAGDINLYTSPQNPGGPLLNISGGVVSSNYVRVLTFTELSAIANVSGGTLNIASGLTIGSELNLTGTGVINANGTLQLIGGLAGNGTLNIGAGAEAGTLNAPVVNGADNGYAGSTVINFNHTGNATFTPQLTGNLTINKTGTGTTILTAANSFSGTTTISEGTLQFGNGTVTGTPGQGAIINNAILTFNPGGSLQVSNGISGTGLIQKDGNGTLTLTGNNSLLSGGITVNGGTLLMGSNTALGSGPVAVNGGTLDLNGRTQTTNGFSGSGGAIIFGTLNSTQGGNSTFSGAVNNSQVVLNGPGALTLAGSTDNVAGTAVVNAGVLVLGKNSSASVHAVGTADTGLTINNGGTARLGGSGGDQIFSGASVALNTGGVLDMNGRSEGFNNLVGGGTVLNSAAATASTLTLGEDNGNATFGGTLQDGNGTVALKKAGSGTLALSGNNAHSGGTSIDAGKLVLVHGRAAGTGVVRVNGGVLQVESGVAIANEVRLSGGAYHRVFAGGADLGDAVDATSNFAGGRPDTTARILEGTLASGSLLETSFATTSGAVNDEVRQSDVYSLVGTGNNLFVLQLSIGSVALDSYLGWLDTGVGSPTQNQWVNAVEGNSGGTPTFFQRGYNAATDFHLGYHGVDTSAGAVWAVLDHNSNFAIVIPEPSTAALLSCALLGSGFIVRRRRPAVSRAQPLDPP